MPNQIHLIPFQVPEAEALRDAIVSELPKPNPRGRLLVCPAGTGKTYALMWAVAEAFKLFPSPEDSIRLFDVLTLTRKSLKIQTARVAIKAGLTSSHVESTASMSKSFGTHFLKWEARMVNNQIEEIAIWDMALAPRVIIVDECQDIKNPDTVAYQVVAGFIQQGGLVILSSATPFTRLSETKATLLALRLCNDYNFKNVASNFSNGLALDEFHPSSMTRLREYLDERGLRLEFKNIKFPHRVFNKVRLIEFESEDHRKFYQEAYERFKEECVRANRGTPEGVRAIWVAMLKFQQAAEMIRAGRLAKVAFESNVENNKQPIIITKFLDTGEIIHKMLVEKFKINPENISVIRGGQSEKLRQRMIDRFQEGINQYCICTGKSGGAGVSLHHDRKNGLTKPRHLIIPVAWSAIDVVQWLGRAHRITSISTTFQDIVLYKDTIEEEKVKPRLEIKLKSLKEIVSRKETWLDAFMEVSEEERAAIERELINESAETDEDGNMFVDTLPLGALEGEDGI
jgi:hypothetical protein